MWARIRQGQADFSSGGGGTQVSPDRTAVSQQSSATRLSPDSGQHSAAQHGGPGRVGHADEAEAAIAALDDVIGHMRPSSSSGVGAGKGAEKRRREEPSEPTDAKRLATRQDNLSLLSCSAAIVCLMAPWSLWEWSRIVRARRNGLEKRPDGLWASACHRHDEMHHSCSLPVTTTDQLTCVSMLAAIRRALAEMEQHSW